MSDISLLLEKLELLKEQIDHRKSLLANTFGQISEHLNSYNNKCKPQHQTEFRNYPIDNLYCLHVQFPGETYLSGVQNDFGQSFIKIQGASILFLETIQGNINVKVFKPFIITNSSDTGDISLEVSFNPTLYNNMMVDNYISEAIRNTIEFWS